MNTLILANLLPEEIEIFTRSGISYSASTGASADPSHYGGCAPYIATYLDELPKSLSLFGWTAPHLEVRANQLIVRRGDEDPQIARARHSLHTIWGWYKDGRRYDQQVKDEFGALQRQIYELRGKTA